MLWYSLLAAKISNKRYIYLVEVDGLHQSSAAVISQLQQVLPQVLNTVDAALNLLRAKVVGLDEVVANLQHCREVWVTRVQLILVRLQPNKLYTNMTLQNIISPCSISYVSWRDIACICCWAPAVIDRYLLAAKPMATNPPQWCVVAKWRDRRQKDTQQFHRPCSAVRILREQCQKALLLQSNLHGSPMCPNTQTYRQNTKHQWQQTASYDINHNTALK